MQAQTTCHLSGGAKWIYQKNKFRNLAEANETNNYCPPAKPGGCL
jgi:hypothetical protein